MLFVDLDFLIGAVIIQVRSDHDGCVVQVQTDEEINAAHFQLGFGIAEPFAGLAVPPDLCSIEDDVGMRGIVFRGSFPDVAAAKTAHAECLFLFGECTEHILKRREKTKIIVFKGNGSFGTLIQDVVDIRHIAAACPDAHLLVQCHWTYTAVFDVEKAVKIRCGKIHWSGELLFVIEKHLIIRIGEQPVQFVVILGQSEAFIVFAKKGSVCAKVLVAPQMLRFVADDDVIVLLGDVDRGNDIVLILSGNTAKNAFELLARCGIGIDKAYFFVRKSGPCFK